MLDARVGDVTRQLPVDRSGLDDDHAHVRQQLLPQRLRPAVRAPLFDSREQPPNSARYTFLDATSQEFLIDWEPAARDLVAHLRSEAGRNPYDRALSDLIGELSTRSEPFRKWWAAHNVRHHQTGTKRLRHPIVGELELSYEVMPLPADGLRLAIFTAELGSTSADALRLLSSWSATTLRDEAPATERTGSRGPGPAQPPTAFGLLSDLGAARDRRCRGSIGSPDQRRRDPCHPRRLLMSSTVHSGIDVHPFQVEIPSDALDDLRRRIAATRWPSKELVRDRSQGVQLATIQELARYWSTDYDFGRVEARLNALPQFVTEIDGVDVHFIHVRSEHENALPLIMTHGWPGSVIELIDSVGPLTDPTAHGGSAEDAFHLVLPSLPGYGFSGEPVEIGWDLDRTARAWAELMHRLGYTRYVAQGGDVGAGVTDAMGRQAPEGLIGIHTNLLVPALGGTMPTDTDEERAAAAQIATFGQSGNGYFVEMATRPQTIGYALLDSPVALAAWMADHDTDAYQKIARAFVDGQPSGNLTRDNVLDNITAYWLTGTGASAARSYWEAYGPDAPAAGRQPLPPPAIPFGFTTFPGEIWRTPRSWVEASYPNVIYFNEVDKGGHFAAWEEPEIFSSELREAFRTLR